jgi:hypothetical protein
MSKLSHYLLLLLLLLVREISDNETLLSEIVFDIEVTQDVLVQDPRDQQVEIREISVPLQFICQLVQRLPGRYL